MFSKKIIVPVLLIWIFSLCSIIYAASPNSTADEIIHVKKMLVWTNVNAKIDSLKKAQEILTDLNKREPDNSTVLYYLALAEYNLVQSSFRKEYAALYDQFITTGENHAVLIMKNAGFEAEGRVLLAGIYMMKISHNWTEAMSLSPKFSMLLDEAEKFDKNNPRIYYMRGLMKFNTPEMFGGSREEALKLFLKAGKLAEEAEDNSGEAAGNNSINELKPDWGKLESYIWAGQAYAKMENLQTARFYYEKVLAAEPEYAWVKYYLLPALQKQMMDKQ